MIYEAVRNVPDPELRATMIGYLPLDLKHHPDTLRFLIDVARHDPDETVRRRVVQQLSQHYKDNSEVIALKNTMGIP